VVICRWELGSWLSFGERDCASEMSSIWRPPDANHYTTFSSSTVRSPVEFQSALRVPDLVASKPSPFLCPFVIASSSDLTLPLSLLQSIPINHQRRVNIILTTNIKLRQMMIYKSDRHARMAKARLHVQSTADTGLTEWR
jgi:hypothetical protein